MSFFIIFVIVTSLGVEGGLTHASESQQLVYHLQHPQELFCSADFAFHARVLPKKDVEEGVKHKICVYDLEIMHLYKGADLLPTNRTQDGNRTNSNTSVSQGSLLVQAYADAVSIAPGNQYILTGVIKDEKIQLNLGSWIEPWSKVTTAYRTGISGVYGQNCACQITPCYGRPCKHLKGCQVSMRGLREFYQGCKWRHSYCLANKEGAACSWRETAEYISCVRSIEFP